MAKRIYNDGGHSKSYARLLLTTPLKTDVSGGTTIRGVSVDGSIIYTTVYQNVLAGSSAIAVQYQTNDVQSFYSGCQVGALPPNERVAYGCLQEGGSIEIWGHIYNYMYNVDSSNLNGRTIAGFSASAASKMLDCHSCPLMEFVKYYNYYGHANYAHHWVEVALDGTSTSFTSGNVDFSNYGVNERALSAKRLCVNMNLYMYVIREFKDAYNDCKTDCLNCNDRNNHSWDAGVAFYTGSLEGEEAGSGDGNLLFTLSNKNCGNHKTCGTNGDELDEKSYVNYEMFKLFNLGKSQLSFGKCSSVRGTIN